MVKDLEYKSKEKKLFKYKVVLFLLTLISGTTLTCTLYKFATLTDIRYLYATLILPFVSFLCLYPFCLSLPKNYFIKTMAYIMSTIFLTYLIIAYISLGPCLSYNFQMMKCDALSSSCIKIPNPKPFCDFIRTEKLLKYMLGYYGYISFFFISLTSLILNIVNIKTKHPQTKYIFAKIISLIILTLAVMFFPTLHNLLTGNNLFKM